jgi:NADH dehydrogenase
MKKILIIGAGFAGLSSLSVLSKASKDLDLKITLINDKDCSTFLPMLPDCLGRGIDPKNLVCDLEALSKKNNYNFVKDRVLAVDLINKQVMTATLRLSYDFLVIASGSETNFYGNAQIKEHAFKLDDAEDARLITEALKNKSHENYLVAGGGYTGVEVATNLRSYFGKRGLNKRIIIMERAPSILGLLPEWMKDYVLDNLRRLDIDVFTNSGIDSIENEKVRLSGGKIFDNSMLIWAAGVRATDFIQDLKVEKNPQGRIKVDKYLRVNDSCFAVGDAGYFTYKNNFLRMAVQFAITQGVCVGVNIVNNIKGKSLIKYGPLDLGYIIPMANNRSCGIILGINMKGLFPTFMHYFMCVYRSCNFKNRLGILSDLIISCHKL